MSFFSAAIVAVALSCLVETGFAQIPGVGGMAGGGVGGTFSMGAGAGAGGQGGVSRLANIPEVPPPGPPEVPPKRYIRQVTPPELSQPPANHRR